MKIVIYWEKFLFYHFGRLSKLFSLSENEADEIIPVSIKPSDDASDLSRYQPWLSDKLITLTHDVSNNSMNSVEIVGKFLRLLSNTNPDVVVIPGYDSLINVTTLIWARTHNKATVLLCDSQENDRQRVFMREKIKSYLVSLFDAGFVAGTNSFNYLNKLGMPKERILTGVDVVDNHFWSEIATRTKENLRFYQPKMEVPAHYFLVVCRLVPKKNIEGLLSVYSQYLKTVNNPWDLVIIGNGTLEGKLKYLVHTLNIESNVHFKGYLPSHVLAPYYGLASAFILPSSNFEQWGLVINEAMAAGLPVLVSEVCGCVPDLVIEGVTGYSFDPFDNGEFLNSLVKTSSDLGKAIEMGKSGQALIQKYSLSRFAENFLSISRIALQNSQKLKRKRKN